MREIDVKAVTDAVAEGFIRINHRLSDDMENAVKAAAESESSPIGREVLLQIRENLEIAKRDLIPICQDTGMAVIFMEVGQDVHFVGGDINSAVDEGVRRAYRDGYLRKSVVSDPIERKNTGDNTPAIIHTSIVPGDRVTLTMTAKGFGSENTSRLFMLKPSDGRDGIIDAVLTAVKEAGANACPPMVIGVGIGGNFEKCALMAKHALTRDAGKSADDENTAELEKELLEKINSLGIGPAGLGGDTTALAVNIETYPTHIAGLPVAVNICCHVSRHGEAVI